ncbi:DUF6297 family protein [Tessaracoccus caeni]|uniref:DUF6297 family protein n=1 Tax=Tessaracoccus caeni TaxID=3031239 RepID=UPI0023D97B41|nr:DUF6297 family protein [Tessaracoccus caeni]MDF1487063.1 DUF6297 family protein [Tessaracoccus caeni]
MSDDQLEAISDEAKFGPIGQVHEKELKLLMRDWRRGRADRSIWQALSDGYVMAFSVIVLGAMLVNAIIQAQSNAAACDTDGCVAARGLLPWAAVAAVLAITLAACHMFGPILASAAEGFWLMDGTADRRRLLAGRLVSAIVVAFAGGAVLAALVAALVGSSLVQVGLWALATGLGAAGLAALAAAEQGIERRWLVRLLQWLLGLLVVGTLSLLVLAAAGRVDAAHLPSLNLELELIVGGVGLVLLVVGGIVGYLRLRGIRRQRLTSGGALLSGMQGAAFALEFALIRDILVEHESRERGHVRPTRGSGKGATALVMRDVQRLWRYPKPLLMLALSAVAPYAVHALGMTTINVTISAIVLMIALVPFMNQLRVMSRTKGLQRCFPFSAAKVRQACMVVPGVLALVWGGAISPAFLGVAGGAQGSVYEAITSSLVAALGGFLGAVRWISAKPASYQGPLVTTGFGAMPPGLMFSMLRGIDMIALVTLPLVLGLPLWVSILIAAIAFSILSSGMDRESMMDQQEESKRILAEQKAAQAGLAADRKKIQVQRNKR